MSIAAKEFKNLCASNGIMRQKTTPRTPQENGVAIERMNCTIMEGARNVRFPLEFWAEAVNTIVYLW